MQGGGLVDKPQTPKEVTREIFQALDDAAYMHMPMDTGAYELVSDIIVKWIQSLQLRDLADG
jgi:hypothetical protein